MLELRSKNTKKSGTKFYKFKNEMLINQFVAMYSENLTFWCFDYNKP